ncbi:HAD family hydrolase [Fictibacillus nanhaiensis]|uniref:HAD family hydrolase n=1 Tax=Fictibacillus nanhaiensis TaxID=742169 RepID=UPI001C97A98C|nr:HAD family hydrolase [Fictibacillus nanhaiensis]MBY6035501.1 HAD family hydrolase [Fictibacillus nanhaiensis]
MKVLKNSAFFFDLDNTLFDYEASFKQASLFAFHSIFYNEFTCHSNAAGWFDCYKTYCDLYWPQYEDGLITRQQYQRNRLVASLLSLNIKTFTDSHIIHFQKLVEEKIPSFVVAYSWMKHIIEHLNDLGYKIGIITNGGSNLQRKKLSRLELSFPEKHIYISSEINVAKPSPKIFQYVKQRSRAQQFFYVGDSFEFDMMPAVQAGWKGIWWNPEQKLRIQDKNIYSCHCVNDLLDIFKKYIE